MTTVWSLNYHELTRDPRVLKQARVLSEAGYDVRVLCDAPPDLPTSDQLDEIKISRFDWASYEKLEPSDIGQFDFLTRSSSTVIPMFEALVRSSGRLSSIKKAHLAADKTLTDAKLYKAYYRDAAVELRNARRKMHRSARTHLFLKGLVSRKIRSARKVVKALEKEHSAARRSFRDLHQARALVFAANVMRLQFDESPDVIHAHDIYTLAGGVLLARRHGCKLIYDAHELEIARATNMGPGGSDFIDDLERDCLEHVDALITVSRSIGDLYADRFPKRSPSIIMNAPEIATNGADDASRPNIRKMAGLPSETPLIVFTGGIQRGHRGVDKVLEALQYLPGVHLATMGPRHEKNDAWFMSASEQLGVRDRVHMLDGVDAREVVPAISSANVSVIPFQAVSLNHEYAMPNKLFEAAFAKVPLAVSQLTEMKRFVEELGIGRAMDQTDPEDIARAIKDILDNPASYRGKTDFADTLEREYSWPAQAEKLLSLYEAVL